MRFLSVPLGEVGDLLTHVEDRLRISVRRGNKGVEGVGDRSVNMSGTVADGDCVGTALDRRGEVDMAARRRVTELEVLDEVMEANEMVDERGRCGGEGDVVGASCLETRSGRSGTLKSDALGVIASSSSPSKQERREVLSESAAEPTSF